MRPRMLFLCLCFFCCTACASGPRPIPLPEDTKIGIAPFSAPEYDWELIAGILPKERVKAQPKILRTLEVNLENLLRARQPHLVLSDAVQGCSQSVLNGKERSTLASVEYWQAVGRCLKVDFMLIPQLLHWQERIGGDYGVETPAEVTFDLYLLEISTGAVKRAHFEERQKSLSENLLSGRVFFKRGGRWLSALDLATEGMEKGLQEFGL